MVNIRSRVHLWAESSYPYNFYIHQRFFIHNMRKIYMSAALLGVLLLTNCHDDLDKVNPNQLTTETYFKTDTELVLAVNSIYSAMRGTNLITREWFWTHNMRSPDWASGGPALEAPRAQILNGGTTPDNPVMTAVFNGLYSMIHRANTVIAKAPEATGNQDRIASAVAEARFLRGWAYFELVNFWGEVPIYTEPVTSVGGFLARSPVADVYNQVIEDLKVAQTELPAKQTGGNEGRASGDAATAFLAKAYMQQLDYASAKTELLKLYGKYTLTPVYNYNFREENEFNSESIWEESNVAQSSNGYNWNGDASGATAALSTTRSQEINPLTWRNAIPSNKLLNEYETPANTPGLDKVDPRLDYTIYFPDIAPATIGIPVTADTYKDADNKDVLLTEAAQGNANKSTINGKVVKVSWEKYAAIYKVNANPGNVFSGINTRIVRYAEVLLMLAEAEAMSGGDMMTAVSYLNELRDRADVQMPHYPTAKYPASTKEQVMAAVIHESTVERGGEEGRDFDTFRWIKAGLIPTTPSPFETYTFNPAEDTYLPIPQTEVSRNPNL